MSQDLTAKNNGVMKTRLSCFLFHFLQFLSFCCEQQYKVLKKQKRGLQLCVEMSISLHVIICKLSLTYIPGQSMKTLLAQALPSLSQTLLRDSRSSSCCQSLFI